MKKRILAILVILTLNSILFAQIPVADFSCSVDSAAPPFCRYRFTDLSTNNPTNWEWFFCDGMIEGSQNPVKFFRRVGTYCVYLTASNSFGSNTDSCYVIVDSTGCYCCSIPAKIESIAFQKKIITVYPNPTTSELHIKASGNMEGVYIITIYDTQGKIIDIITINEQETVLDISKYKPGIYWVNIIGNNVVMSKKIIKTND